MNQSQQTVSHRSDTIQTQKSPNPSGTSNIEPRSCNNPKTTRIISLSKLKNYMPQNIESLGESSKSKLGPISTPIRSGDKQVINRSKDSGKNSSTDDWILTRAQAEHKIYTQLLDIEEASKFQLYSNDHQQANIVAALHQVGDVRATQQEFKHLHPSPNNSSISRKTANVKAVTTSANRSLCIASSNKGVKEVELCSGTEDKGEAKNRLLDREFFSSDRSERKRKKIDNSSLLTSCIHSGSSKAQQSSEIDREKKSSCGYVGANNNMTPSALLRTYECATGRLLPFEQHSQEKLPQQQHRRQQHQYRNVAAERDNQHRLDQTIHTSDLTRLSKINAHRGEETPAGCEVNYLATFDDQTNDIAQRSINSNNPAVNIEIVVTSQDQSIEASSSALDRSLERDSVHADAAATPTSNNSNSISAYVSQPLKTGASLRSAHLEVSNNNRHTQQLHTSNLNLHDINSDKLSSTGSIQNNLKPTQHNSNANNIRYCQSNFTTSMLAGQQFRLEDSYTPRRSNQDYFELAERPTVQSNIITSDPNREIFTHQTNKSANIDQSYYNISNNSNYNLIQNIPKLSPTNSSDHSTPSPKTHNSMQALNVGHNSATNQLLASGLNHSTAAMASAESHLDNLNHHYMNSNVANLGLNHQHHQQLNHHYSTYNSQASAHHLNIPGHDQSYSHAQQQQQQQQAQQHTQNNISQQQSIYNQIANEAAAAASGGNHAYGITHTNSVHYHNQPQSASNQANNLMTDAHHNHLNTAAAACAAAAVVSQTLKTVANQHNSSQHNSHHYAGHVGGGFGTGVGLMNMTSQHHQQAFHSSLGQHHHLSNNQGGSISAAQHQMHHQPIHHQQASVVTRKYQCKMCPQVFMSKAEMKYHNQNHMREAKPYKCLQCPKAFANSSYLSQHMRIHQGLKPYTCEICSRKFTQLSHLQQHKRTHTGDKPYKCNYMNCTKQFSQLSNLQSHSRCHQLDKPYKCNSCYKCFHDEPSLLEHIPRHLESKHLKKNLCIFCGSSYQQERGLVKHFQQYHTDKTPTLVAAAIAAGTTGNTSLIASLISSTQSGVFVNPSSGSTNSTASSLSSSGGVMNSSINVNNSNNNNTTTSNMNSSHKFTAAKCDGL